jgi:hypothetical protein
MKNLKNLKGMGVSFAFGYVYGFSFAALIILLDVLFGA